MDLKQFNRARANSFHQQKNLIEQVLAGKKVKCPNCQGDLRVSAKSDSFVIACDKGCTRLQLEHGQQIE